MPNICPLCGQPLPKSIDAALLHTKLENLTSNATRAQRSRLEKEFAIRASAERQNEQKKAEKEFAIQLKRLEGDVDRQICKARELATVEAERSMKQQVEQVQKQMRNAAKKNAEEVANARREASDSARREVRLAIERASFQNEKKLVALQNAREKEQVRHSVETAKLQGMLEDLSRKLEKQSGERFGEEGEINLYAELVREFPNDTIERVGRGVKGADIIQRVMDGGKEAGCIVYESKNVSSWQNAFLSQAKKYHTQYETPYVMIVSRVFPKKKRGMCVMNEVPIVEPCLAIVLATVMREGILQVAKLRLTNIGCDEKAQELFSYIIGNEFQTRFRDLAEAVVWLRDYQRTERNWHENHWTKESALHAQIEKRHCEIGAKLHLIARVLPEARKPMAITVGRR